MSSEPERTADELELDPELSALLREVARPAPAGPQVAAHLRGPEPMGLDAGALQARAGLAIESEPKTGDLLDRHYRIERELGRGGMGVVYEAHNLNTGKRVALKWMSVPAGLTPERVFAMSRRFRREARAAASVRHPNVVDIYDVAGADSAPFLVMELLEGEPLRARMSRSRMRWDEALSLLLPVLRGVAAMHRAGVIHRDLKPDNIFLCGRDEAEDVLPKVLDFGVAAMQDSADGLGSLTRSGALLGTPSYMALEQLTGKEIDARTDLYALGVVLYEMLTGKLPFSGARGAGELAVLQATSRPSSPALISPELRGARADVLLKALARDPGDRFQSAEAFAVALLAARAPTYSAWLAGSHRRALTALGLILVLSGLAWWHVTGAAPRPPPPSAERAAVPLPRPTEPLAAPLPATDRPARVSHEPAIGAESAGPLLPPPAASERPRLRAAPSRAARVRAAYEKSPTDLSVEDF